MRRLTLLTIIVVMVLATIALRAGSARRSPIAATSGSIASASAPIRRPRALPTAGRAPDAASVARQDDGRAPSDAVGAGRTPRSLRDTAVDGGLLVDRAGRFVASEDARRFFDYFLIASGEQSPAELRARIVAEIESRLAPDAAAAATALLDRYLAYRERTRDLADAAADLDAAERLARLRRLREEVIGPADAKALFGDQEEIQAVDVARQRIAQDESMSADERARAMVDLEQQLPASERAARAATLAPLQLTHEEARLRAAGGSAEEIRTLRESYFGSDAATRLEQLDRARVDWQERLSRYRDARAAIERDAGLSTDERGARARRLLTETFTPAEQRRVAALDRIAREQADEPAR